MIAHNEVADEAGIFERSSADRAADSFPGDPPFEPRRDGFIIRTRSDALEAKLNSVDISNAMFRMEKKLDRLEWIASIALGVLIVLALKLLL